MYELLDMVIIPWVLVLLVILGTALLATNYAHATTRRPSSTYTE